MDFNWTKAEQQWRKELLSHAKGSVLEIGIGTGENFKYYPKDVKVTGVDCSARIIDQAKKEALLNNINAGFIISPVEDLLLRKHSFDTIVSTFQLSAYENTGRLLGKLNSLCKADGTILLMEYGLSKHGLVNWLQRKWEPYHYRRTGSHINRDMLSIITASKLSIKKIEVRYAGIVYMVWATLKPASCLIMDKV